MDIDLTSVHRIRQEYKKAELHEETAHADALQQFNNWFSEALMAQVIEPNAMTLATVNIQGQPSARIVLLKKIDEKGFTFFTNYTSHKAQDIENNKNVSLVFFWPQLERQVRIMGTVDRIPFADSEVYFHSRPFGSQIGAIVSPQSKEIENRALLDNKLDELLIKYKEKTIPMPTDWGGYLVKPEKIEFWQGRPSRLHDRLLYTRVKDKWKISRLAP